MRNHRFWIKIATFAAALCLAFGWNTVALAAEYDDSSITSQAAMLIDESTGTVLYSKNAKEQVAPASTTKIMTASLLMEQIEAGAISLDDVVEVGDEISSARGSMMGLSVGDRVTVEDLLYGMMLNSGNDAALAVAKLVGGTVDDFVDLMNERAQELGMTGTHFSNPHGMDDKSGNHYVTVEDMARLAIYSGQFPLLREIASTSTYTVTAQNDGKTYTLQNTNKLIYYDPEMDAEDYTYDLATGLKTGNTPNAGYCLVATATSEDGSTKLIALIYGDQSEDGVDRWSMAESLLEYGFDNYVTFTAESLAEQCNLTVNVADAASNDEGGGVLVAAPDISDEDTQAFTMLQSDVEEGLQAEVTPVSNLTAPVREGDVVGTAVITVGGETIFSGNILATRDVAMESRIISPSAEPTASQQIEVVENGNAIRFQDMWYWFLIPLFLIVFLIIRAASAKRRHKRYAHTRMNSRARVPSYSRRHRRRYKYRARARRRY